MIVGMFFFFQAEDGIRDVAVTGVQTCALPISFRKVHARKYGGRPCCAPGGLCNPCLMPYVRVPRDPIRIGVGSVGGVSALQQACTSGPSGDKALKKSCKFIRARRESLSAIANQM